MRNITMSVGEHYHICNRGIGKQVIFHDKSDYARFLFLILHMQSPLVFQNISRPVHHFVQHSVFNIDKEDIEKISKDRYVELVAFCLMPNHFHLILKEVEEGGTARYMQRVLNGYAKYYNTKYEKSGHLFQGPYRAVHVHDNEQLLYLSTYVHRNPRELQSWKTREERYPWSSYQDYCGENRWNTLLAPAIILEQFKKSNDYAKFVCTSTAKLLAGELQDDILQSVRDL
jgi:putative transposase